MSQLSRVTNTAELTPEQRGQLAYALEILRSSGTLQGWSQYRHPTAGPPRVLRLLRKRKGKLEQVWGLWSS
jgi:hypothetical protein